MADEVEFVYGSDASVISQSADILDAEIVGGDTEFTNAENYPLGEVTIDIAAFLSAVTAGLTIDLLRVRGDVRGTTGDDSAFSYGALTTTDAKTTTDGAELVGAWVLPAGTSAYVSTITIGLNPGSARYYIRNNSGQTIDCTPTAMTVDIAPVSYKPGA